MTFCQGILPVSIASNNQTNKAGFCANTISSTWLQLKAQGRRKKVASCENIRWQKTGFNIDLYNATIFRLLMHGMLFTT